MVGPKPERGVACTSEDWEELEQFREMLLKFLTSKCRDWSEAQDLVQETLLRAARYRDKLRDRGRLRAWVMQIAANVFRDQVRRAGRVVQVPLGEDLIEQLPASEGPAGGSPSETLFQLEGALGQGLFLAGLLSQPHVFPKAIWVDLFEHRLLNEEGVPTLGLEFYVLGLDGDHAGVTLRGGGSYAVADPENGPHREPLVALFE